MILVWKSINDGAGQVARWESNYFELKWNGKVWELFVDGKKVRVRRHGKVVNFWIHTRAAKDAVDEAIGRVIKGRVEHPLPVANLPIVPVEVIRAQQGKLSPTIGGRSAGRYAK